MKYQYRFAKKMYAQGHFKLTQRITQAQSTDNTSQIEDRYELKGRVGDAISLIDKQTNKTHTIKLNQQIPDSPFPYYTLVDVNGKVSIRSENKTYPIPLAAGSKYEVSPQQTTEIKKQIATLQNLDKQIEQEIKEIKALEKEPKIQQDPVWQSDYAEVLQDLSLKNQQKESVVKWLIKATQQMPQVDFVDFGLRYSVGEAQTQVTNMKQDLQTRKQTHETTKAEQPQGVRKPDATLLDILYGTQQPQPDDSRYKFMQFLEANSNLKQQVEALIEKINKTKQDPKILEDMRRAIDNLAYGMFGSDDRKTPNVTQMPNAKGIVQSAIKELDTLVDQASGTKPVNWKEIDQWVSESLSSGRYDIKDRAKILMILQLLNTKDLSKEEQVVDFNKLIGRVQEMWKRIILGNHPRSGKWGKPPFDLNPPYYGVAINPTEEAGIKQKTTQQLENEKKYKFDANWRSKLPQNQEQ